MTYSFYVFSYVSVAKLKYFSETDKRFSRKMPICLQKDIFAGNTLKNNKRFCDVLSSYQVMGKRDLL